MGLLVVVYSPVSRDRVSEFYCGEVASFVFCLTLCSSPNCWAQNKPISE